MDIQPALAQLEMAGRTARTAARIVALALIVTAVGVAIHGGLLAALAIFMAAGTLAHTANTLGAVLSVVYVLADDAALDRDIIANQQELIAVLRGEP